MSSETPSNASSESEGDEEQRILWGAAKAWLGSSAKWADDEIRLPDKDKNARWIGKDILSISDNAIVGLWNFVENGTGKILMQTAIKQKNLDAQSAFKEGDILERLNEVEVNGGHIIPLLKRTVDKGQGSYAGLEGYENIDPLPDGDEDNVERFYMPYCKQRTMQYWMEENIFKVYPPGGPVMPEIYFWKVFECLARGLCAMAYGSENPRVTNPVWDLPDAYAHLNIKPENILVGNRDDVHPQIPPMKIAGFGTCIEMALELTEEQIEALPYRIDPNIAPPEYTTTNDPEKLANWSNVWQIAKCVSMLITKGKDYRTDILGPGFIIEYSHPEIKEGAPFNTFGPELRKCIEEEREGKGKARSRIYSENVDKVLYSCLALNPRVRPKPGRLLRSILTVLKEMGVHNEDEDNSEEIKLAVENRKRLEKEEREDRKREEREREEKGKEDRKREEKEREKKEREKREREEKRERKQKEWEEWERKKKEREEREREAKEKAQNPHLFKRRRLMPSKKLRAFRVNI